MERHNRSREKNIAPYIRFAKSLQWRDGDDLAVDVDFFSCVAALSSKNVGGPLI